MKNPKNRIALKFIFFSLLILFFSGVVASCASTKTEEYPAEDTDKVEARYEAHSSQPDDSEDGSQAVAVTQTEEETPLEQIKLPSARPKSYFAKIDSEVLANVENGSAENISKAI